MVVGCAFSLSYIYWLNPFLLNKHKNVLVIFQKGEKKPGSKFNLMDTKIYNAIKAQST